MDTQRVHKADVGAAIRICAQRCTFSLTAICMCATLCAFSVKWSSQTRPRTWQQWHVERDAKFSSSTRGQPFKVIPPEVGIVAHTVHTLSTQTIKQPTGPPTTTLEALSRHVERGTWNAAFGDTEASRIGSLQAASSIWEELFVGEKEH